MELLFKLILGHVLADYVFQPESMQTGKRRPPTDPLRGGFLLPPTIVPWWNFLLAHAVVHAGAVWLATGNMACALTEIVTHCAIDTLPANDRTSHLINQMLHLAVKLGFWAGLTC